MTGETQGCEKTQGCECLIARRYVFGPFDKPLVIILESPSLWDEQHTDTRKAAIRFLPVNVGDPSYEQAVTRAWEQDQVTLYKLPAGHVAIVRLSEVDRQGYLFEVEQLPPANQAKILGIGGQCMGNCPPYVRDCPRGSVPDCSTGSLQCRPLSV